MAIVFATPAALISHALKTIGVLGFGRNASAAEIADGLTFLNVLLDEWSVVRANIYVKQERTFPLVVGTVSYTIGSGGVINTTRPVRIEEAFYRNTDGTDILIDTTMTEEEYQALSSKDTDANPTRLFYKQSMPLGTIYFNFVPTNAYTVHLINWDPFSKITNVNQGSQLALPDGYEAAIVTNLAVALCTPNKKQVSPELAAVAARTLSGIQSTYSKPFVVGNWDTPSVGSGKKSNFFSGGM